jgi:predicted HAD superfamily Cof-like phosphohydrolase
MESKMTGINGALEDVHAFAMALSDDLVQDRGRLPPALVRRVGRWRLLKEEVDELEEAIMENDIVGVADAYADIIYIVLGSAIAHLGKDRFARVWEAVHASNMAKIVDGKVVVREDGKVLKPDGWRPPAIAAALDLEELLAGNRQRRRLHQKDSR